MGCNSSTMTKTSQMSAPAAQTPTKAQTALVADVVEATTVAGAEPTLVETPRAASPVAQQQQDELPVACADATADDEPAVPMQLAPEPEVEMRAASPLSPARLNGFANASAAKRKVVFDAETLRNTAPQKKQKKGKGKEPSSMTKKQKSLARSNHVSAGRRGPVASRWDKSKSNMQSDVYMQMTNAFERLLTNASTLNAHLDTR